jgi:hypothetical protein
LNEVRNTVVFISGYGTSDALNGLMRPLAALVKSRGFRIDYFEAGVSTPDDVARLGAALSGGDVRFAVTYLGLAQDVQMRDDKGELHNAWEAFEVPLIKLHGDIAAYFPERHGDVPSTAINLYLNAEFAEFHRWSQPQSKCLTAVGDPYLLSDLPLREADFKARRRGKLVFVKNGGDPDELIRLWWDKLPEAAADQLVELAGEASRIGLRPGPFPLHEFVLRYLAAHGIDERGTRTLIRLYVAQLDDYLRRLKSTMIATALLPFPVVIQGARWDHVDFSGARAQLVPPQDFTATEAVFQNELGVIDMSPNVDSSGHDRAWRAAGTYAFLLTNKSTWLEALSPQLNARAFEFQPESIGAGVEYALAHPAECVELGEQFGKAFRKRYPAHAGVDKLLMLADLTRLQHAAQKPQLQRYFVW